MGGPFNGSANDTKPEHDPVSTDLKIAP